MRIIALVENTTARATLKKKHGLCIYVETAQHKLLFDLGPDDTFIHNADKLGINLSEIDTVVISHGHIDHGGALNRFLQINNIAKIYIHKKAFEPHYIKLAFLKIPVGIDAPIADNNRVVLTDKELQIDDELLLFSDVAGQFDTKSNRVLLAKKSGEYVRDAFAHEQNLLITSQGKTVLFSGCSHRGIPNILEAAQGHKGHIDVSIGGFHLFNPATRITESINTINALGSSLSNKDTVFYTCHCTRQKAFSILENSMQGNLKYFSTGTQIDL